jgi:hypothetical protein
MLNTYRITRLDRFTAGVANSDLKAEQRTPGYFITAPTPEDAASKLAKHLNLDSLAVFDVEIVQSNVEPLFPAEKGASA